MASTINAKTTGVGGIDASGDASGVLALQTGGTTAVTIDASQNVVLAKGLTVGATAAPAFFVRKSANQTISSGVETKIVFDTETFDTASCFNNTGSTVGGIPSYSFLPNVAGYYQLNLTLMPEGSTALTRYIIIIQKNGSQIEALEDGATINKTTGSYLVYLNGSTDYVSFACYIFATVAVVNFGNTVFSGAMVRSA